MTKTRMIATAIGLGVLCASAQAQYTARVAPSAKLPSVTTASSQGGYLIGADDCNAAHPSAGTGNVAGVPYTTGTTGTTGQANTSCLFFGTDDITNDVWIDWTANMTGTATFDNCGNATDTKVAVYPLSTCPADNTNLGCNDDSCGLQSAVSWACTAGTSYTIQLGTFPGAAGGSGTFNINQTGPAPCGQKDDGSTENALGLTAGGEMGWLTVWGDACLDAVDSVETAYGTLMFPGSVTNGANSKVVAYSDASPDNDPTTNLTVIVKVNTVVVNGDTDILNKVPLGTTINATAASSVWTLVSADQVAGQFPGPMDQTPPTHAAGAWVVGSTLGPGSLNTTSLTSNDVAPLNMAGIGFAANWLSRVDETGGGPTTGTPLCFGDGTAATCPCANTSQPGSGGCRNSVSGAQGALYTASGTASVGVPNLVLDCQRVRTQPGLHFQGNNTILGGTGQPFGDGLRCCGGSVIRLFLEDPAPTTEPVTVTTTISTTPAGVTVGDKRCYQYWYRDPGGPCGTNFNLSNAVTVMWGP